MLAEGDPNRLGPFELVERLGEGGQGVVFLGRGPAGERVAIKLLHTRLTADEEARERFLREVALAQRVARFCTAPVLYADLAGNQPYIVSEYVPGPSLRQLVDREGPRGAAALERLAISTATALAAIHRAGITHRDFKPANVLMGPEGPVVIDFGVARALDSPQATATGNTLGTPAYLAPELLSGGDATGAADVFAWGVTMVFAATGNPAFGADSIPSVINRILNTEPDLSALTSPLRELVAACLSKDPALRPSADVVVAHLTGQQTTPVRASGANPTPGEKPHPEERRSPNAGRTASAGPVGAGPVGARPVPGAARPAAGPKRSRRLPVALAASAAVVALAVTAATVVWAQSAKRAADGTVTSPAPTQTATDGIGLILDPSPSPSPSPTRSRTATPTARPTAKPSPRLTTRRPTPTASATPKPTSETTKAPTKTPTPTPTATPTPTPTASAPKPNPYTAQGVCGSAFKVIDSHSWSGRATTFLLYNASTGKNCVVTLSKYVVPGKIKMGAVLQVKGGASGGDWGNYTAYAGPIRLAAGAKCVIWGGGYGATTWKSAWSHCG